MATATAPELALWWYALAVLLIGGLVIVLVAAIAAQFVRSAWAQRTLWRAAVVAMLGLLSAELSGAAPVMTAGLLSLTVASPPVVEPVEMRPAAVPEQVAPRASEAEWEGAATTRRVNEPSTTVAVELIALSEATEPKVVVESPVSSGAWWPGIVWIVGVLVVVARWLTSYATLLACRRRFRRVDDPGLVEMTTRLGERLGLRYVRLVELDRLTSPAAFGLVRSTIVLPAGFAQRFDRQQQEAVLAHELGHLAAGDARWQALGQVAAACWWWHPGAWFALGQMRGASEVAADEASLIVPDGPSALADSLVRLGRHLARRERLGWLTLEGGGFRSSLGHRVERLLKLSPRPWQRPSPARVWAAMLILPVACVVLAVACTAWARNVAPANPEGDEDMNVLRVTWRSSLAAALWATLGAMPAPAAIDDGSAVQSRADLEWMLSMRDDDDREPGPPRDGDRPPPRDGFGPDGPRDRGEGPPAHRRPEGPPRDGFGPDGPRDREGPPHHRRPEGPPRDGFGPDGPSDREGPPCHRRPEGPPRDGFGPDGPRDREGPPHHRRPEGPPREGFGPESLDRRMGPPREGFGPESLDRRMGPPRDDRDREVRELREQIGELRHEMREMRELLRRLVEREGK